MRISSYYNLSPKHLTRETVIVIQALICVRRTSNIIAGNKTKNNFILNIPINLVGKTLWGEYVEGLQKAWPNWDVSSGRESHTHPSHPIHPQQMFKPFFLGAFSLSSPPGRLLSILALCNDDSVRNHSPELRRMVPLQVKMNKFMIYY